jgi:hypothetical protein
LVEKFKKFFDKKWPLNWPSFVGGSKSEQNSTESPPKESVGNSKSDNNSSKSPPEDSVGDSRFENK